MQIYLYQNFSKRADSTAQPPNTYTTKDVTLKQETSIESPVFILSGFDVTCNYVYVPSWGRYYFVSDWKKGNNDLYAIECTLDHLATYKDAIGNYTAFVERTSDSSKYDTGLYDGAISSSEKIVSVTSASTELFSRGGVIVCRVLNTAGICTYIGSMTNFADLFDPNIGVTTPTDVSEAIENLLYYMICDPPGFILDVYFLPIPLSLLTPHCGTALVQSGWYVSSQGAYKWTASTPYIDGSITVAKPASYYSDFREGNEAFSKYSIHIPAVGEMNLPGDVIDKTLTLSWACDVYTGDLCYNLKADGDVIATYNGNIKSPMKTGSMIPSAGAVLSSATGLVTGVATGNPLAIGASVVNATQNIIGNVPSVGGSQGSCVGFLLNNKVIVTQMNKASADIPVNVVGRPCCKNLQISTLSGYVKCAGANLVIAGTITEKNLVNASLNNGFYYE